MSIYKIRGLGEKDLGYVKAILEHWIKDCDTGEAIPEEVAVDLALMRASLRSEDPSAYIVAVDQDGVPQGVIGLKPLDPDHERDRPLFALRTGNFPCEVIHVYVDPRMRGKGLGRLLVQGITQLAITNGYDEILLNSGRRYKDTAWDFYDKLFGQRRGIHIGRYGAGRDAPVWGLKLPVSGLRCVAICEPAVGEAASSILHCHIHQAEQRT